VAHCICRDEVARSHGCSSSAAAAAVLPQYVSSTGNSPAGPTLNAKSPVSRPPTRVLETAAGQERWSAVLATTREPIVSSDITGDPHAAIVDLSLTKVVDDDLGSVYSWYDNEFGYTNWLVEHVVEVARHTGVTVSLG
jgi:Glyceraldehyde 3-phosphate dehydrogenase, C-terminal domain